MQSIYAKSGIYIKVNILWNSTSARLSYANGHLTITLKANQWTFRYCNDIGVTSPSIYCIYWHIVNETHDDINLTSRSWDWTNQNLMSLWHRRDNGRYAAEKNPPRLYTSSVSATIMPLLYYGNWKIKASGDFSSVAATENKCFFQNSATVRKSHF